VSTIAAEHIDDPFRADGGEAVALMSTNADRPAQYGAKHKSLSVAISTLEAARSAAVAHSDLAVRGTK